MINKITIPDIERKYKSGEINTSPINNYPIWKSETFTKETNNRNIMSKTEFIEWYKKNINCLLKSRVKELKTIFGKEDFTFKNEYTMYAWTIECKGCQAIIMSGTGKGTVLEIILNEKGRPKGSVDNLFFEYKNLMRFLSGDVSIEGYEIFVAANKYNL